MSTKAGTLGTGKSTALGNPGWTVMLVVAALAVAALVMSFLALQQTSPTVSTPRARTADSVNTGVYERSHPVTGTGPGLAVVGEQATFRAIYERSAPITGTGPDLVRVAEGPANQAIYRNSGPATGTGPGLEHMGT
jgi:hypothetical protein